MYLKGTPAERRSARKALLAAADPADLARIEAARLERQRRAAEAEEALFQEAAAAQATVLREIVRLLGDLEAPDGSKVRDLPEYAAFTREEN